MVRTNELTKSEKEFIKGVGFMCGGALPASIVALGVGSQILGVLSFVSLSYSLKPFYKSIKYTIQEDSNRVTTVDFETFLTTPNHK